MSATDYGVNGGWGGLRVTEKLVEKFDYTKALSLFRYFQYSE